MRNIFKDVTLAIDGSPQGFRLTKPDAFSGVEILRLVMRLQDRWGADRKESHAHRGRCAGSRTARDMDDSRSSEAWALEEPSPSSAPSVLDLITSLSGEELRSVMTSCLNHVSVLLPAGPNPVMSGSEWGYPELKHDTVSCMKLVLEEIAWALEGFFGDGGRTAPPADATISP